MDAASAAGPDRDAGAWTTQMAGWAVLADSIPSTGGSRRNNKPLKVHCILHQTDYSPSWLHNFLHFGIVLRVRRAFERIPRRQIF
jgi:hypothetical protein